MSKQETVEVTLKLPKALVDFIRTMEGDVEEYLGKMPVVLERKPTNYI